LAGFHLSIVVPTFNESGIIKNTLREIDRFISKKDYKTEVIFVDDGSTDQTVELIEAFVKTRAPYSLIKFPQNKGKGAAVKEGMMKAAGIYQLFCDADLSTPLEEVNKLLGLMKGDSKKNNGLDIALGSRRVKGALIGIRQPFFREALGRVFSLIVRWFVVPGFLDTQCGFKLFTREAAQNLFPLQRLKGFCFDVEVIFLGVKKFNYKIQEVPVVWNDTPKSHVQLLVHPFEMLVDLLKIKGY